MDGRDRSETSPGSGNRMRTSLGEAGLLNSVADRETILWRRLDLPGHDTAVLLRRDDGWRLSGVAVFLESGRPCRLGDEIACDLARLRRRCSLAGSLRRSAGA